MLLFRYFSHVLKVEQKKKGLKMKKKMPAKMISFSQLPAVMFGYSEKATKFEHLKFDHR